MAGWDNFCWKILFSWEPKRRILKFLGRRHARTPQSPPASRQCGLGHWAISMLIETGSTCNWNSSHNSLPLWWLWTNRQRWEPVAEEINSNSHATWRNSHWWFFIGAGRRDTCALSLISHRTWILHKNLQVGCSNEKSWSFFYSFHLRWLAPICVFSRMKNLSTFLS